jgi:hypothetical protein
MKNALTNMTVLALLLGISGCLYPSRDWRDWRGDRYGQGYRDRNDRYEQGHRDQSPRNCWSRGDGQVYCRNYN